MSIIVYICILNSRFTKVLGVLFQKFGGIYTPVSNTLLLVSVLWIRFTLIRIRIRTRTRGSGSDVHGPGSVSLPNLDKNRQNPISIPTIQPTHPSGFWSGDKIYLCLNPMDCCTPKRAAASSPPKVATKRPSALSVLPSEPNILP